MSEMVPIARSPISPPPPATVEHGWEVSARRTEADLRITDQTPLAKVLVQASPNGGVARMLDVPFGRAARDERGVLVVGSGPGEWLLLAPPGTATEVADRVEAVSDDGLVSVVESGWRLNF